jgi:hypothetical protein
MLSKRNFVAGLLAVAGAEFARRIYNRPASFKDRWVGELSTLVKFNTATDEFDNLEKEKPWLRQIRKTVGFTSTPLVDVIAQGSVVLLDNEGTLAICGHEVFKGKDLNVSFAADPYAMFENVKVKVLWVNETQDIAFATLDKPSVDRRSLIPVVWKRINETDRAFGESLIFTGFQSTSENSIFETNRLHAVEGRTKKYEDHILVDVNGKSEVMACKIEADVPTKHGMSGGGIFDSDGNFMGLLNSGNQINQSDFTPLRPIWDAYAELFPERAKKTAHEQSISPANIDTLEKRPACEFDRREFFGLKS